MTKDWRQGWTLVCSNCREIAHESQAIRDGHECFDCGAALIDRFDVDATKESKSMAAILMRGRGRESHPSEQEIAAAIYDALQNIRDRYGPRR